MIDVFIFNVEHRTYSFTRAQPMYGMLVVGGTSLGWDLDAPPGVTMDHELFDASGQGRTILGFGLWHDTLGVPHKGRGQNGPTYLKILNFY